MRIFIICFDGETIAYSAAFLDKEEAEERLRIMQDAIDAEADKHQCKTYSQFYTIEELELVFGGPTQSMTLEEIYEL